MQHQQIEWCRTKFMELLSKGENNQSEIAYPTDQKKFILDIKISLLQMNLNYVFLPTTNTDGIDFKSLESLDIHKTIYFDGFSKNVFFGGVNDVLHGAELILLLYVRFSNSLSPSSTHNKN